MEHVIEQEKRVLNIRVQGAVGLGLNTTTGTSKKFNEVENNRWVYYSNSK